MERLPAQIDECHPRVIELARILKEMGLDWEVCSGDWFETSGQLHIVVDHKRDPHEELLLGRRGDWYRKSEVVPLRHYTDCLEWLRLRRWRVRQEELAPGRIRVEAYHAHSDLSLSRTEPTELAATYAVMQAVLEAELGGGDATPSDRQR